MSESATVITTERNVRAMLAKQIAEAGSIANLAKKWKVSEAVISLSASGARNPAPIVLKKMKVTRTTKTTYTYSIKT